MSEITQNERIVTQSDELLPCPFCGRKPNVIKRPGTVGEGGKFFCFISCSCGSFSARAHQYGQADTPEIAFTQAAERWNTRFA